MRFKKTNTKFYIVHVAEKSHSKYSAWGTAAQHQFGSFSLNECEEYIKSANNTNRLTNLYYNNNTNKLLWWVTETNVSSGELTRSFFYTSNKKLTKITIREAILLLNEKS